MVKLNINNNYLENSNMIIDDKLFFREGYPYLDSQLPLVSPINPKAMLYPTSTRNYFNIDLLHNNYDYSSNLFKTTPLNKQMLTPHFPFTPKDIHVINLQNKILINDDTEFQQNIENLEKELIEKENKENLEKETNPIKNENTDSNDQFKFTYLKKKSSKPSIDLCVVNESETNKIFAQSVANSYQILKKSDVLLTKESDTLKATDEENVKIVQAEINKSEEINNNTLTNSSDEVSYTSIKSTTSPVKKEYFNKFLGLNNATKASLNLSPKSAFMKMKR